MLTKLRLVNFKSWADTKDVSLPGITGLFGTNSSGKTSLLQALLLLKQTASTSNRGLVFQFGDESTAVGLGDFKSVVHKHDTSRELRLDISWTRERAFEVIDTKDDNRPFRSDTALGFSTTVHQAKSPRLAVKEMTYKVGQSEFGMKHAEKEYKLHSNGFPFIHSVGRKWPLPPPVRCYGFPDQARAYFQNAGFLADLELAFEECLRSVYYLGPLRAYPERRYTWTGAEPSDMGRAGELVVDALLGSRDRGASISPGYKKRRLTLEEYVAKGLKHLGLIHSFRVVPLAEGSQVFEVKVRRTPGAPEVLITDVGFGVSQILPVLVLCAYVPEGSTVILEQPEIHLHPAVQAGLADILVDAWKNRRVQILLESHSEHLLRRLQRRVAEREIDKKDVGLYFCTADEEGSELTTLDLDVFGNISNWPKDFFGDEFGEIAAISLAAQRQRKGLSA